MEEKDFIKDLFADKLANAQAQVNPELWSAISSKIGASTAVSTGLSTTAKWLIGLGTAASVTVAATLLVNSNNDQIPDKNKLTKVEPQIVKTLDVDSTESNAKDYQDNFVTYDKLSIDEFMKKNNYTNLPYSFWEFCRSQSDIKSDSVSRNSNVTDVVFTKTDSIPVKNQTINQAKEIQVVDSNQYLAVKSSFEVKQLPSVFTINNDGINEQFFIEMKGIEDFVLTILNTKNEVVYSAVDADFKWDGRDKEGNIVAAGSYVYFFTGKDLQGNSISKHNNLTVIVK